MDPIAAIYGVCVSAALVIVLVSGSHVLQKIGLLLMIDWAASNLAVACLGFHRAPLMVPSLDAAICLGVALIGHKHRSNTALAIVCLYAIVGVVHVTALVLRMQETYTYYATLNLLFLAQLLILGGSGAWLAIRNRAPGGHQRPRYDPPRFANSG